MSSGFLARIGKLILCCALTFVSFSTPAASTLTFDGDDYLVQVVMNGSSGEAVSHVLITPPGQGNAVALPRSKIQIIRFDSVLQVIELRYRNAGDAGLPASFGLSVQRDTGFLDIEGRRIRGTFDWSM